MGIRRFGPMLGAAGVALAMTPTAAAAHGTDIDADFDDGQSVAIELTDETGEICVRFDQPGENPSSFAIAELGGTVVAELGADDTADETCRLFDPSAVDAVLADVDGHQLTRIATDGTVDEVVLRKPPPPASETALAEDGGGAASDGDDKGPNVLAIFAAGAALGLAVTIVRKRLAARR